MRHKRWCGPNNSAYAIAWTPDRFLKSWLLRDGIADSRAVMDELWSSRLWASLYVTRRWVEKGYFTEQFDARLELLGCEPKVTWWSPVSAPAETIIYPDAVALAGMFIAPYWRAAAKRGSPEFFAEAARRLRLPHLSREGTYDPLVRFVVQDIHYFERENGLRPNNCQKD
ncbi:MAG TPA: hypothetical protein VJ301_01555 [Propionibacteriaceae bacterium]|nr:hypothetical protein [Propionibacteriaceae bacterium]